MGYHLTILRSRQGKQVPIPLEEARHAAPAFGWEYEEDPPAFFLHRTGEATAALWHQDGELWTKDPEDWTIAPMVALASALDARVRGDEFETYTSGGESYFHPDDARLRKEAERESQALIAASMGEHKRIRNFIIAFFIVLGAIGYMIGKWFEQH
jgi:hypothetical protein